MSPIDQRQEDRFRRLKLKLSIHPYPDGFVVHKRSKLTVSEEMDLKKLLGCSGRIPFCKHRSSDARDWLKIKLVDTFHYFYCPQCDKTAIMPTAQTARENNLRRESLNEKMQGFLKARQERPDPLYVQPDLFDTPNP